MLANYFPILLTVAICIFARPLGEWLRVMDRPDGVRKTHRAPTPLIGGVAIVLPLALWLGAKITWGTGDPSGLFLSVLLCCGGVAVIGFLDDQHMISPSGRLILLAIFSLVALKLDPTLAYDRLYTVAGGTLFMSPTMFAVLIVVALTGFSSAVNLADGLNGLVLALICVWTICLALSGGADVAQISELIAAESIIALLFNYTGRLFLGDCGAFSIAFAVGLLAIQSHNLGRLPLETALVWFLLPVVDCLRLIPLRLWLGRSPFRPDRRHFHYRLSARFGEAAATWSYVGLIAVTSFLTVMRPQASIICIGIQAIIYLGFLFADALAARGGQAAHPADVTTNVVALDKKAKRAGDA
jgi:UDP-GlcNAc:undecaprenyl-phosphate/decaprenyl-phosphate GlcNAc-1-phosphate transferase